MQHGGALLRAGPGRRTRQRHDPRAPALEAEALFEVRPGERWRRAGEMLEDQSWPGDLVQLRSGLKNELNNE